MTIPHTVIDTLRQTFIRLNYTIDGLHDLLGDVAFSALFRHEPVPVWLATDHSRDNDTHDLAQLVRLLLLGDSMSTQDIGALFRIQDDDTLASFLNCALFTSSDGMNYQVALDVRPIDTGFGVQWVFSDLDGALFPAKTHDDHVLGVGEASLSLLRSTPIEPVNSLLDIGTGCGIQTLHAAHYANDIVATDLSPRCCELAKATLAINQIPVASRDDSSATAQTMVDIRQGSWFEPVHDQQFDAIVANPPFVVASQHITHSYRDSSLDLDGATQLMIENAPLHLKEGGHATILGAWVHCSDEDYRARLSSWIARHGVDAWIVERDCVDPALYVSTWMKDSGRDPADPQWHNYAADWLTHFSDNNVEGVGFGIIFLRKTTKPSSLMIEELTTPSGDALAAECLARWERWDNLQRWDDEDLLSQHFALSPQTIFIETATPSLQGQGTTTSSLVVSRADMPSFRHTIDESLRAFLNGLSREGLSAGETAQLLCTVQNEDWTVFRSAICQALYTLYLHGIITL